MKLFRRLAAKADRAARTLLIFSAGAVFAFGAMAYRPAPNEVAEIYTGYTTHDLQDSQALIEAVIAGRQ